MEMTSTKKKLMLAAILTSGLTLAISQASWAADPVQPAMPDKQADVSHQSYMKPELRKAHEKFLDDTVAIRKEMAEKHAVMRALIQAATPDTTKVAQVAGELFELREKLRMKAKEVGLPMPMGMGLGKGGGKGGPGCYGSMMGNHYQAIN
ncbi:MAG: hypothetical protein FWD79_06935 [Desulfobulbus sp.]|nr:hypothetical protein [Desulfobulbus sp.]